MNQQNQAHLQKEQEEQEQIRLLEQNLRAHLSKDAISRYGNIRAANPELAVRVLIATNQIIQKNNKILSDAEFKAILYELTPKKRSIRIKRK